MELKLNKMKKRKLLAVKLGGSFFMADDNDSAVVYQVTSRASIGVVKPYYRDLEHVLSSFADAEAVFEGDSLTLTF
jgi:hypothetical protein